MILQNSVNLLVTDIINSLRHRAMIAKPADSLTGKKCKSKHTTIGHYHMGSMSGLLPLDGCNRGLECQNSARDTRAL